MKKLAVLCILALGQLISSGTNLGLTYPVGGEKLPINGTHIFTWTNSDALSLNLFIDWYDTNGTPVLTNSTPNDSLYATTLPAGTNTFTFYMPSNYPGPDMYKYKVRLEGSDAVTNVKSMSGYVNVTAPASFTGSIEDTNQWLPGQSKNIDISWSGFQASDTCDVILEAPNLNKVGYGFLMTNITLGAESGTQVISIAYPSNAPSAYPPNSFVPMNGEHSFTVINRRCGIIQTFGSIDILTTGLRMYLVPLVFTNVMRGDSITASEIILDATLATNDVSVTEVSVVLTSYSTNWLAMMCNLMGPDGILSADMISFRPQDGSNYNTLVTFPVDITLPEGETESLALMCSILGPSELGSFIWNTENVDTNMLAGVTATYVDDSPIPVSVIKSASAFIGIEELINPRFLGGGISPGGGGAPPPPPGGASINWDVICKPNTSYLIQCSTNLMDWDNMFTTNTVAGTMALCLTNQNPWCFFRLKEN
jgi:hypothetical protein